MELMNTDSPLRFLQGAARLLLQYNMRTALLEQRLQQTAAALGLDVQILTGYRQLSIHALNGVHAGTYAHVKVHELRINIAVSARVNWIIDELCGGLITLPEALQRLDEVEQVAEKHGRGVLALMFGCAAAALAEQPQRFGRVRPLGRCSARNRCHRAPPRRCRNGHPLICRRPCPRRCPDQIRATC